MLSKIDLFNSFFRGWGQLFIIYWCTDTNGDLPERFGKIETDWSYVSQKTQRLVTDVMSETPVVSMTTSLISLCHLFVYILFF